MITLPPGIVDADTAVIQDATGAIVLRLGDGVGTLRLGDRVEVAGTRSTKSGMETLRVSQPAIGLGRASLPHAPVLHTGDVGEAHEALFVTVRGALAANARRSSTGSVSFEIDDGSGGLKVAMGQTIAVDPTTLTEGTWIEVTGVLGQVTTGSAPASGYRVWPATRAAVRVTAPGGGSGGGGPVDRATRTMARLRPRPAGSPTWACPDWTACGSAPRSLPDRGRSSEWAG